MRLKEILIFAGTTEGRKLSEYLADAGVRHTVCVATKYGEAVLKNHALVKVHQGRMNREEISKFLQAEDFAAVVDATHPYAEMVTRNVRQAAEEQGIPYLRLLREHSEEKQAVQYFETNESCARALMHTRGNILLTTGSKELYAYCVCGEIKERLYVRILPAEGNLKLCMEQGICGKQVIAMQGPFSVDMNVAILRQYHISCLVTKDGGLSGGYQEKLEAAAKAGVKVFVIGRPKEEGYLFPALCAELEKFCGKSLSAFTKMDIVLAGVGMGSYDCMTKEVQETIEGADILLGSERMLKPFQPGLEKRPFYRAEQIVPYLEKIQEKCLFAGTGKVVILFSGDSGFYSGCRLVHEALVREIREGRLSASVRVLPGISSVSYLASQIGESYHDAQVYSMHGKSLNNLAGKIKNSEKTFLILSGAKDMRALGEVLLDAGLSSCMITAGFQLSYEQQKIHSYMPQECFEIQEEGLYTCLIRNPDWEKRRVTHGIGDDAFLRAQVPMTKEEVREVSICKLHLHEGAIVYDIGSGSGSIAVEIAALSDNIQVYAIEKKKEALALIHKNKEKFRLSNIAILESDAPAGLVGLSAASHAFIGGSGGKMKEILKALYQKNPAMRIVINAVTLETVCEIRDILCDFPIRNEELVQLQANRMHKMGRYHLPKAENPVWVFAFTFDHAGGME